MSTPASSLSTAAASVGTAAKTGLETVTRYQTSLTCCLFVFLAFHIAEFAARSVGILSLPAGLFLLFFIYQWLLLYSRSLSRARRAFFDEVNVLETYQPRARTHGHLFVPDPPTPGMPAVDAAAPTAEDAENDPAKRAFKKNRDAHYANMFEEAMRLNAEMNAMQKAAGKGQEVKEVASDIQIEMTNSEPLQEVSTRSLNEKTSSIRGSQAKQTEAETKKEGRQSQLSEMGEGSQTEKAKTDQGENSAKITTPDISIGSVRSPM